MAVFTIGDLHLSLGCDKPMDVFDGWQNYVSRLEESWKRLITNDDTVILAGDISWAMKLENCKKDFEFINNLSGKKIILKGNHDYWWTTMSKMQQYVAENNFKNIKFLHNNCYLVENIAVCGTRGWLFDVEDPKNAKIMQREVLRLKASLEMAESLYSSAEKVVFLHYPPVCYEACSKEIINCMLQFDVKRCFYGHLHSASIIRASQGEKDGIVYKLISADALAFSPLKI